MRLFYMLLAGVLLAVPVRAQVIPALPAEQVRLEAIYRLTYRPDSAAPATRSEMMRLQVGSQVSRFESLTAVRGDSAVFAQAKAAFDQAKAGGTVPTLKIEGSYRTKFRGQAIFKMPASRQVVVTEKLERLPYAYLEPDAPAWTIGSATATVAGYTCQRATATWAGRRWEAWFTREVPVPDGPYKFYGLPGLVVQVADSRQHYVFELAKLRQLTAPVALELPAAETKPIGKAAFQKAQADYSNSATERMLASGNLRFNTPEEEAKFRQQARERAKRPTNPIELW
jgi:GLPGLI family protein